MRLDTILERVGTTTVLPPDTMCRQEVDHRVATSLQLISSLLSLQARQAADVSVRDALGVAAHRIDAVGAIHKRLHQSGSLSSIDIAPYLFDLAQTIEQSFGGGPGCKRTCRSCLRPETETPAGWNAARPCEPLDPLIWGPAKPVGPCPDP